MNYNLVSTMMSQNCRSYCIYCGTNSFVYAVHDSVVSKQEHKNSTSEEKSISSTRAYQNLKKESMNKKKENDNHADDY